MTNMTLATPIRYALVLAILAAAVAGGMLLQRSQSNPEEGMLPNKDSSTVLQTHLEAGQFSAEEQNLLAARLTAIQHENMRIEQERVRLQRIAGEYLHGGDISEDDFHWLKNLANEYKLEPQRRSDNHFFEDLLDRVDIVPASLLLAQAAVDSKPGPDPLCHEPACTALLEAPGNLPTLDTEDVLRQRLHNLNTHPAFTEFRTQRKALRDRGEPLTGRALAAGLRYYSLEGERYVEEVQHTISVNTLDMLD